MKQRDGMAKLTKIEAVILDQVERYGRPVFIPFTDKRYELYKDLARRFYLTMEEGKEGARFKRFTNHR